MVRIPGRGKCSLKTTVIDIRVKYLLYLFSILFYLFYFVCRVPQRPRLFFTFKQVFTFTFTLPLIYLFFLFTQGAPAAACPRPTPPRRGGGRASCPTRGGNSPPGLRGRGKPLSTNPPMKGWCNSLLLLSAYYHCLLHCYYQL